MNKKKILFLTLFLIVIFVILLMFTFLLFKKKNYINPLKVIPNNALCVIRINNLIESINSFKQTSFFVNSKNDNFKERLEIFVNQIDSLSKENRMFYELTHDSSLFLIITLNKKNALNFIIVSSVSRKFQPDNIINRVKKAFYQQNKGKSVPWFYYFADNLFVLGNSKDDINSSFQQLGTEKGIIADSVFLKVYSTLANNSIANIAVNLSQLNRFAAYYLNDKKSINSLIGELGWIGFDTNITNNYTTFSGFSCSKSNNSLWSKLTSFENSVKSNINEIIPSNAIYFATYSLSDFYNYYLAIKNIKSEDINFKKKYDEINKILSFEKNNNLALNGFAEILIKDEKNLYKKFWILLAKTNTDALNFITSLSKISLQEVIKRNGDTTSNIDFKIFKLPLKDAPQILFGNRIDDDFSFEYIANYKNFVIWSENSKSLRSLISYFDENKTMWGDSLFANTCSNLYSTQNNILIYINLKELKDYLIGFLKSSYQRDISELFQYLPIDTKIGYQILANNKLPYHNAFIYTQRLSSNTSEPLWIFKSDTMVSKIFEVNKCDYDNDFKTKNYILLQEKDNNIYMINLNGTLIFKYKADDKIMGSPYLIKLNNKENGIIFNTKDYLYELNMKGKSVHGFPIKFKNPATSGLTVADFDKKGDYRIYIPLNNKSFVALSRTGGKIDGWLFNKTPEIVTNPSICFTHKTKDYIVVFDKKNIFVLNRKGKIIVNPSNKTNFDSITQIKPEFLENYYRLWIIDKNKNITLLYPDGKIDYLYFSKSEKVTLISDNYKIIKADSNIFSIINPFDKKQIDVSMPFQYDPLSLTTLTSDKQDFILIPNLISNDIFIYNNKGKLINNISIFSKFPLIFLSLSNDKVPNLIIGYDNKLNAYDLR